MTREEILTKLDDVVTEINKLEKIIDKQEADGNYDDGLYSSLDELEAKRLELTEELNNLDE